MVAHTRISLIASQDFTRRRRALQLVACFGAVGLEVFLVATVGGLIAVSAFALWVAAVEGFGGHDPVSFSPALFWTKFAVRWVDVAFAGAGFASLILAWPFGLGHLRVLAWAKDRRHSFSHVFERTLEFGACLAVAPIYFLVLGRSDFVRNSVLHPTWTDWVPFAELVYVVVLTLTLRFFLDLREDGDGPCPEANQPWERVG